MSGPVRVRKKPVEVQAYRYDGTNSTDIIRWTATSGNEEQWAYETLAGELVIRTLEGDHVAAPGDWVMRGVEGEFYPCKPSIFAATYDELGPTVGEWQ